MRKPMSKENLQSVEIEGMTASDKKRINMLVDNFTFPSDKDKPESLRAYLVTLCDESIIDDNLRADLHQDAAAFSDGWDWCLKYGLKGGT